LVDRRESRERVGAAPLCLGIYDTIRLSAADAGYRANTTEPLREPSSPDIHRSYVNFLIDTERFQDLTPFDREAAEQFTSPGVPSRINMCERVMLPTLVPRSKSGIRCVEGSLSRFRLLIPIKATL